MNQHLYTIDQVLKALTIVRKHMDVTEQKELFREASSDQTVEILGGIVRATYESEEEFHQVFTQFKEGEVVTANDYSWFAKEVMRNGNIIDLDHEEVQIRWRTMQADLFNIFKGLLSAKTKDDVLKPNDMTDAMNHMIQVALTKTILLFMHELLALDQVKSVKALHNFLYLVKKVARQDNATTIKGVSVAVGVCILDALECFGTFPKYSDMTEGRSSPSKDMSFQYFFFAKITELLLNLEIFKHRFPSDRERQFELYPSDDTALNKDLTFYRRKSKDMALYEDEAMPLEPEQPVRNPTPTPNANAPREIDEYQLDERFRKLFLKDSVEVSTKRHSKEILSKNSDEIGSKRNSKDLKMFRRFSHENKKTDEVKEIVVENPVYNNPILIKRFENL